MHRRIGSKDFQHMDPEKKLKITEQLRECIIGGDIKSVQSIISEGFDISKPLDENGQTVLHEAAYSGQAGMIVYFMEDVSSDKRPNINARDNHGWTALLCAASVGNIGLCYYLLQRGADPKLYNDQKTSPLHYLCRKIPQHESQTKQTTEDKKSWASKRFSSKEREVDTYFEVLDLILEKGVEIDCQNYLGETPLMQAASKGNEDAVTFLLEHKADCKKVNLKGETVLFYAERYPAISKLLNSKTEKIKKELRTYDIRLENFSEIVSIMSSSDNGVPLSEKKSFFITYQNCFSGSDLVDWILKKLSIRTRD